MNQKTIINIIVILFIILFLYTGISKIMDYSIFKEQIAISPLLAPVSQFVAIILPWVEFLIILLLIVPKWRLTGLYASLGIMVIFTIYIIAILNLNDRLPCSCGGVIELLSWKQHILFNSLFLSLGLVGIILEAKSTRKQTLI